MPNINDVYPSKWLRAPDLRGRAHTVTIADVELGTVGSDGDEKTQLILHFTPEWKPLGLNKTNAGTIATVHGDDTDDWISQKIVIFPTQVPYGGKMVDAIRVDLKQTQQVLQAEIKAARQAELRAERQAEDRPRKAVAPVTQAEADSGDDEEIPF